MSREFAVDGIIAADFEGAYSADSEEYISGLKIGLVFNASDLSTKLSWDISYILSNLLIPQ